MAWLLDTNVLSELRRPKDGRDSVEALEIVLS
jgi:predicted nucleic acid-binding protein